jgi:hypothetical protein
MEVETSVPMVEVVVDGRRRRGRLLGRMTRVEGRPVAAEVALTVNAAHPSERITGPVPVMRYTLVPVGLVEPLNTAARRLMDDAGPVKPVPIPEAK